MTRAAIAADAVAPAPNGSTIRSGYNDWRTISVSHRTDNNTLRAILGNDIAIKAAREGKPLVMVAQQKKALAAARARFTGPPA